MTDIELKKALQATTRGLLFTSESDKPVTALLWPASTPSSPNTPIDETVLAGIGKVTVEMPVQTVDVDTLFAPMVTEQSWFGDTEKAQVQRFQELLALLKAQLTDLHAFRVPRKSDPSTIDVYVIGRAADGALAGIHSQLVET